MGLGQRQRNRELLALGYRMMAMTFFVRGKLLKAREYIEHSLACADFTPEEHKALAVRHWLNPRVVALAYGAVVLSTLGQVEQSLRYSQEALELAERIGHPHSLACALTYLSLACQLRRDAQCALKWADRGIALSDRHGFRMWFAWSMLLRSWALSELGRPREGLALMQKALAHWRAAGIPAGMHHSLGMLAEIHLRLGQPKEALAAVDEALKFSERMGESSYNAMLYQLRGKALYELGREEEGAECLRQTIRTAREQGASAYERHAREILSLWSSGARSPAQARQSG